MLFVSKFAMRSFHGGVWAMACNPAHLVTWDEVETENVWDA
jgi:hypothetical protein